MPRRNWLRSPRTELPRTTALNLNVHYHLLVPDGAWVPGPGPDLSCSESIGSKSGREGRPSVRPSPFFRSVQGPTTEDVEDLVVRIADACERFLARRGFGEGDLADDDPDSDDAQVLLQQASVAGIAALGRRAGRQVRRLLVHAGRVYPLPPTAPVATATTSTRVSASRPMTGTASSASAATSPGHPWAAPASRNSRTAPSAST